MSKLNQTKSLEDAMLKQIEDSIDPLLKEHEKLAHEHDIKIKKKIPINELRDLGNATKDAIS